MKKRKPLIPELTQDEKDYLLPKLIKYFQKQTSKSNPKTQGEIEKFFGDRSDKLPQFGDNPMTKNRMMKLIQYIRGKELLPIASGNKGYWLTDDPSDLQSTINEFQSRIDSFQATMNGLKMMKQQLSKSYVKIPKEHLQDDIFNDLSTNEFLGTEPRYKKLERNESKREIDFESSFDPKQK
jgi:hypothetical protein